MQSLSWLIKSSKGGARTLSIGHERHAAKARAFTRLFVRAVADRPPALAEHKPNDESLAVVRVSSIHD